MLERLWGKGNTSALLVGMQAGTAPLDVSVAISQKIRKQPSSRPSNTTLGYIPKGCSIVPQGHVLNYVHSSIVCHSRNLERSFYIPCTLSFRRCSSPNPMPFLGPSEDSTREVKLRKPPDISIAGFISFCFSFHFLPSFP